MGLKREVSGKRNFLSRVCLATRNFLKGRSSVRPVNDMRQWRTKDCGKSSENFQINCGAKNNFFFKK